MDFPKITIAFIRDFLIHFQIITAIFATVYYSKYRNSFLKYFLFLVWYTVLNDFFALYYYSRSINENNAVLYNAYQIISFSYFFILFQKTVVAHQNKKIIACFTWCYIIVIFINLFYQNFIYDYLVIPYLVGGSFILISIILYFIEILNSDKIIFINKLMLFWISVALLFLYTGNIPLMVARNYYSESPTIPYILNVNYFLNFIVNLLYISGFIWSGKDQKD